MRIAVTGASGKLGGQVVRLLGGSGEHEVVALARRPVAHESPFVRSAYTDYADLASLRSALRRVDVLVFVSSDGDAAKMMVHHQNVARAATDNEVSHVVYLSGVDADVASPFCYAYTNGFTEELITESGCGYTFARASIYIEFFLGFLRQARTSGEIRLPAADGRLSLVSRQDVGRCLAALATSPPTRRHHDITGPESLDLATMAKVVEREWETTVRYSDISPAAFIVELANGGEDPWWSYAYSTMFASVREQRWSSVSDEVHRLTGRPPLELAAILRSAQ